MSLKIITLIENSADEGSGLECEHGLSFFIEKDGKKILFDTGQTGKFLNNAAKLGVDLSYLDYVVISHGHYDHSGGFTSLAEVSSGFRMMVGSGFFTEKYSYTKDSCRFLGNNFTEADLEGKNIDCRIIKKHLTEIEPGIFILTSFPRTNIEELVNPRFKIKKDGKYFPDPFDDEVLIVIDTPKGLVVIFGCCHPGMRNMLDAVKRQFKKPIHTVLGGTHLKESGDENLELSVKYLCDEKITQIGVSHCTGEKAMARLKTSVSAYFHNITGSIINI